MTQPAAPASITAAMPRGVPSVKAPTARPLTAPIANCHMPNSAEALPACVPCRARGMSRGLLKFS